MLRFVIDEFLNKSFDYFLKGNHNKNKNSKNIYTNKANTIQQQRNNLSREKPLHFQQHTSILDEIREEGDDDLVVTSAVIARARTLFDELDWFRPFRRRRLLGILHSTIL